MTDLSSPSLRPLPLAQAGLSSGINFHLGKLSLSLSLSLSFSGKSFPYLPRRGNRFSSRLILKKIHRRDEIRRYTIPLLRCL